MALRDSSKQFTERDWQTINTPADPVRFAMIGLGWWTVEKAIPATKEAELCKTTVLVSNSEKKANSVAAEQSIDTTLNYDEYKSGEGADAYDAVYIATPNNTHLEYTKAAAELEKHVLCEKPLEASSDRAQQMVDVCADNDVTLMTAYRMQTEPVIRRARELLDDGVIGTLNQIHSHISIRLLEINPDTTQWKLDLENGGGAMFGNGIYPLNTIRFLLDEDPESVQATAWSPDDPFSNVDEHISFQLTFPDGVVASCSASHNTFDVSHLRLLGTEGEMILEPIYHPWEPRTMTLKYDGGEQSVTVEDVNQMVEEFEYFSDCLVSGRDPLPDGTHGREDIELIERIHKAAETGNILEL